MADLHGEARVLVRTTTPDELAGALRVADVTSEAQSDGGLLVDTADLRLVGDVALRAGLPIYELRAASSDLEAVYFQLTEGTNRNLGAATAVPEPDAVTGQEGGNA